MENKIITIVTLSFLFIAFGIVSFLVIVTKRNPYFISKKLRLGALIISLSSMSMLGSYCQPVAGCYFVAEYNQLFIDQEVLENGKIIIQKGITDTISGNIHNPKGDVFSYAIVDTGQSIIAKNDIVPDDGVFDEYNEEFKICINTNIPIGIYNLRFYSIPKDSIKKKFNSYFNSWTLRIKN